MIPWQTLISPNGLGGLEEGEHSRNCLVGSDRERAETEWHIQSGQPLTFPGGLVCFCVCGCVFPGGEYKHSTTEPGLQLLPYPTPIPPGPLTLVLPHCWCRSSPLLCSRIHTNSPGCTGVFRSSLEAWLAEVLLLVQYPSLSVKQGVGICYWLCKHHLSSL